MEDFKAKMREEIYTMDMFEDRWYGFVLWTRVPNGWVYTTHNGELKAETSVFIPWHDEFRAGHFKQFSR